MIRVIIASIAAVFSLVVILLSIRGLLGLRREKREFHEMQERDAQLVRELDAFNRKVSDWEQRHPEENVLGDPEYQVLLCEGLRIHQHFREVYPDFKSTELTVHALSLIKPRGAA